MAPVIDQGGHTHRVAPAREDPAHGWATRYSRTVCRAQLDTTRPALPETTVVTCPRCQRANTKEN
ncbi:hypothetical protein NGM33_28520 [Nocardiopsis dassonvillei]|uniref:hypothetical protein n=1 Tax=Nocardiopsis dassonvillei TaxID=2014 RepID=UPI0020A3EEF9|nr:hypothetical protein [Nocardiopsis dassonvillei]MCP3017281.1 hypothetical protein [Nocardiopsis dassonvillei]